MCCMNFSYCSAAREDKTRDNMRAASVTQISRSDISFHRRVSQGLKNDMNGIHEALPNKIQDHFSFCWQAPNGSMNDKIPDLSPWGHVNALFFLSLLRPQGRSEV